MQATVGEGRLIVNKMEPRLKSFFKYRDSLKKSWGRTYVARLSLIETATFLFRQAVGLLGTHYFDNSCADNLNLFEIENNPNFQFDLNEVEFFKYLN